MTSRIGGYSFGPSDQLGQRQREYLPFKFCLPIKMTDAITSLISPKQEIPSNIEHSTCKADGLPFIGQVASLREYEPPGMPDVARPRDSKQPLYFQVKNIRLQALHITSKHPVITLKSSPVQFKKQFLSKKSLEEMTTYSQLISVVTSWVE